MNVVGGDASITAQELPTILAHTAVLHVIVFFLLLSFFLSFLFIFFLLLLGLPLYPLLLLGNQEQIKNRWEKGNKERDWKTGKDRTPKSQKGKDW